MAADNTQYLPRLQEVTALSIDEQTKGFLRAFVTEFQGKFEQVLDLAEEFKTYLFFCSKDGQLDEQQTHMFLEKKGEAATVVEFREKMRQIDLDFNKRVSVTEYKKTLKEMFEAKPSAHLIKMLEDAITEYQAVFQKKKERNEKIAALEKEIAEGGPNAYKAKAALRNLQMHDSTKDAADEISALANKLKAKRALANPEEENKRLQEEAFKEEQARVAAEQRKKDEEEKKKAEESKNRLKERAKLWS